MKDIFTFGSCAVMCVAIGWFAGQGTQRGVVTLKKNNWVCTDQHTAFVSPTPLPEQPREVVVCDQYTRRN